jgi:hypothetical protein
MEGRSADRGFRVNGRPSPRQTQSRANVSAQLDRDTPQHEHENLFFSNALSHEQRIRNPPIRQSALH